MQNETSDPGTASYRTADYWPQIWDVVQDFYFRGYSLDSGHAYALPSLRAKVRPVRPDRDEGGQSAAAALRHGATAVLRSSAGVWVLSMHGECH